MPREFPIVIKKNGVRLLPKFPVELEAGDQFIIVKELRGSQVPNGDRWRVNGYSDSGPIITVL